MKNRIKDFYMCKPNIIDTIAFIIIVCVFIIEIHRNIWFKDNSNSDFFFIIRTHYSYLKNGYSKLTGAIVITLLPLIFTNIFISIQMLKEKRAGISIAELRELRGKHIYSFLRMAIIICISFALYGFFALKKLPMSMLMVSCVSLFYAVFFSIQEIPILTNNKYIIMKIIRKEYSNIFSSDIGKRGYFPAPTNNCVKAINYYILSFGLDATYKNFKNNDTKIIENLISNQLDYFKRLQESLDNDLITESEFEGIDINKAISMAYSNFDDLFIRLDYSPILIRDNMDSIVRNILLLHKICEFRKLTNLEKNSIDEIVSSILINGFSNEKRNVLIEFLLKISILTLKDGRDWFVKRIRDNHFYPRIIFERRIYNIGLFLSVFISHVYGNKLIGINETLTINKLIFEKMCGLNSFGVTWASELYSWIESGQLEESINDLLECYDMLGVYYYSFFFEGRSNGTNDFTKKDLFNVWLEILLMSNSSYRVNSKIINDVLNKLSNDNRSILIDTLSNYWIKDNKIKYSGLRSFLGTFKFDVHFDIVENEVSKCFFDFRQNYLENEYIFEENENLNNNENHEKITKHLCDSFKNLSKIDFFDREISLQNEILYFPFVLENEKQLTNNTKIEMNSMVDAIDEFLPNYFNSFIQSNIMKRIEPVVTRTRFFSSASEEYYKILDFKPDIISSYQPEINSEIDKDVKRMYNSVLPINFYCKAGAIKYNIEFYEEFSKVNEFSDADAINYLNDNYEMVNGLYRYSPYANDNTHSILLTREKLLELIKKRYFKVNIAFKFGIKVDSKKCLCFKYEDMNKN